MSFKLNCVLFMSFSMIAIAFTVCLATNDDQKLPISLNHVTNSLDSFPKLQPGDWKNLDPNDPKVVDLAKFAVKEANKRDVGYKVYKYVKVMKAAYTQFSYFGNTYDLLVKATEIKSGVTDDYIAFVNIGVIGEDKGKRFLLSFSPTFA
ncbi:uncharacterized protein LOC129885726 [Solanum dulcamara]|uniref:uncharacterized protein LOC129885726 n=1 Tax=Solanum dulcamara TaxID=45834 RepID=UPI0024854D5A|nr:uncharacterized protein LOC129885726 [Solanum dulcamara]